MNEEKQKKSRQKALPIFKDMHFCISHSALATYRLGQICGRLLKRGVMALFGDLGSGKTVFAKGVASALGIKNARREVISPSFMIIREHPGRVPFYHMDLYRVSSEDEIYFLNLKDYFYRDGITLVEWAERAWSLLPQERLEVYFETLGKKERSIQFKGLSLNIKEAVASEEKRSLGKAK